MRKTIVTLFASMLMLGSNSVLAATTSQTTNNNQATAQAPDVAKPEDTPQDLNTKIDDVVKDTNQESNDKVNNIQKDADNKDTSDNKTVKPDNSNDSQTKSDEDDYTQVAGTTHVIFVDEKGNEIDYSDDYDGFVGDEWQIIVPEIYGYRFKAFKGADSKGNFSLTAQEKTIKVVYTAIPAGDTHIHYVDQDGDDIADEDVFTGGQVGDYDTVDILKIDGYTFDSVIGASLNSDGEYEYELSQREQNIYVNYNANKAADVHVYYVDEKGNDIADEYDESGNIDEYDTAEIIDIKGYTFEKFIGADKEGNFDFGTKEKTVYVVYSKDAVQSVANNTRPTMNNKKTIINNKKQLPQTGDNSKTSQMTTITGLIILLSAGYYVISKKRAD